MLGRIANSVLGMGKRERGESAAKRILSELRRSLVSLHEKETAFFAKEKGLCLIDHEHLKFMREVREEAQTNVHKAIAALIRQQPSSPHIHSLQGEELLLKLAVHYLQKGEIINFKNLTIKYKDGVESHDDLNNTFEQIANNEKNDEAIYGKALEQLRMKVKEIETQEKEEKEKLKQRKDLEKTDRELQRCKERLRVLEEAKAREMQAKQLEMEAAQREMEAVARGLEKLPPRAPEVDSKEEAPRVITLDLDELTKALGSSLGPVSGTKNEAKIIPVQKAKKSKSFWGSFWGSQSEPVASAGAVTLSEDDFLDVSDIRPTNSN